MTPHVALVISLLLAAPFAAAQTPAKPSAAQPNKEVSFDGELENYIAVGGETTGWRLRTRTEDGRRRFIEILLTAEMAQGVRVGDRVRIRGTMQTRHYVERGDVEVLLAKSVIQLPQTRR